MSAAKPFDEYSLIKLYDMFVSKYGANWHELEEEAISLDLGIVMSTLLLQKVRLLKALCVDSSRTMTDPLFLIHTSDIINNEVVDPTGIAMPTSLEMAYTVYVLNALPIGFEPTRTVQAVCEQVLKQDGYYEPVPPFTFVSADNFSMAGKALVEDLENKEKAIKAYIHLMETV